MALTTDNQFLTLLDNLKRNPDPQERAMAISDLKKGAKLAGAIRPNVQQRVREQMFSVLTKDVNNDTKAMASEFIGECHGLMQEAQINQLVQEMGTFISTEFPKPKGKSKYLKAKYKRDLQDNLNTKREVGEATKKVIRGQSSEVTAQIAPHLTRKLLTVLERKVDLEQTEFDLELLCLDLVNDILKGSSAALAKTDLARIPSLILGFLSHRDDNLRRAAASTTGPLVQALEDEELLAFMTTVVNGMKRCKGSPVIHVIAITTISDAAASRISSHLHGVVNALLGYTNMEVEASAEHISLLEETLKCINSIVQRCPAGVDQNQSQAILESAAWLLEYDPFYDDSEVVATVEDDWGGSAAETDAWANGDYKAEDAKASSDDASWKVRREASNLLGVVASVNSTLLKENFESMSNALMSRFAERDSNVKAGIFQTMQIFVREAVNTDGAEESALARPSLVRQRSLAALVIPKIPDICYGAVEQFWNTESSDVHISIMALLTQVVRLCPNDSQQQILAETFEYFLPVIRHGIMSVATSDSTALAAQSLECITALSKIMAASYFTTDQSYSLMEALGASISYGGSIAAPSLHALGVFVQRIVPTTSADNATWMAACVMPLFEQKDVDEAIKFASISCMGTLFATYGTTLSSEFKAAVPIFVSRMDNLTTANACAKAIKVMAGSDSGLNLSVFVSRHITTFCSYMRKSIPRLPVNAAQCIAALVNSHSSSLSASGLNSVIAEAASHITASDLALTANTLDLVVVLLKNISRSTGAISNTILPVCFDLVKSPYVGGQALSSLASFFEACVASKARESTLSFSSLSKKLQSSTDKNRSDSITPIARCLAKMITAAGSEASRTVSSCVSDLGNRDAHVIQIALYTLGELGALQNLNDYAKGAPSKVLAAFDHKSREVRKAAAYAYGNVVAGDLSSFSALLNMLDSSNSKLSQGDYLYLCLSALKAALTIIGGREGLVEFERFIELAAQKLLQFTGHRDDAARGTTAECLGRLIVLDSLSEMSSCSVLRQVCKLAQGGAIKERMVAVSALRLCFQDKMNYDALLVEFKPLICILSGDNPLELKTQFVDTLAWLVVSNPGVIDRQFMQTKILPELYKETKVVASRIKVVDYGAMKENVDAGLPLRRAVFKCLVAIMDNLPRYVDFSEFITAISNGVNDGTEILTITVNVVNTLCRPQRDHVVIFLNGLFKLVQKTLMGHIKTLKKKDKKFEEEKARSREWAVALFRGIAAWNVLPEAAKQPKFQQLIGAISKKAELKGIWEAVLKDMDKS